MTTYHVHPSLNDDSNALDDLEIFYMGKQDIESLPKEDQQFFPSTGFYYQYGLEGYLPSSEPYGPYTLLIDAMCDARYNVDLDFELYDRPATDFLKVWYIWRNSQVSHSVPYWLIDDTIPLNPSDLLYFVITWGDIDQDHVLAWFVNQSKRDLVLFAY